VKKRLGEMLIEAGVIDETQLQAALGHQRRWGGRIGQALVHLNLAREDDVVEALGRKFGFETARLDALEPYALGHALALVPRDVALANHLLPIAADTATITVAMSDPTNVAVMDELRFRTGRRVVVKIAGELAIGEALKQHYPGAQGLAAVEAIALDLEGAESEIDTLLDPFGGGSTDELQAFFSAQSEAHAVDPAGAAAPLDARGGACALELEDGTPAAGYRVVGGIAGALADELEEEPQELVPIEDLPAEDLLPEEAFDAGAESYFDAAPLEVPPASGAELDGAAFEEDPWTGDAAPAEPHPEPTTLAELAAAPAEYEADGGGLADDELAVLGALDRIAHGVVPEEPTVVKPAQIAAALVRLLIRKGIVTDQEFLDELLRR
jgi:hypothetical protein